MADCVQREHWGDKVTPEKREKRTWEDNFIAALEKTGNVSASARKAKISRNTVYELYNDPAAADFKQAWNDALEVATDDLEMEARRRAAKGVLEPVYYRGKKVGSVRRYSDTLIIFLLKAHRPQKFRENVDVTSGGEKLTINVALSDD